MADVSIKAGTFQVGGRVKVYQGDNAKGPVLATAEVKDRGVEARVRAQPGTRVTVHGPRAGDGVMHEVHSAAR